MTHVLSKFMLLLVGTCVMLNIGMIALGSVQPAEITLAGFSQGCSDRPQPCWYGIVPGITHADDLLERMTFAGEGRYSYDDLDSSYIIYFTLADTLPACVFAFRVNEDVVVRADVSLCRNSELRLGDIALLSSKSPQTLSLPPHDVVYGAMSVNVDGWPTPHSPVSFINLLSRPEQLEHYAWHGFVPLWRYCQFEPEYPQCR